MPAVTPDATPNAIDTPSMRHAGRELLSLALIDARNRTLQRQWTLLEPFARTYLTIAKSHVDRRDLAERHRPILAALHARDPRAASEAMRRHLLEAGGILAHDG